MQQRLYGVLAKVMENGVVIGKPIFQTTEKEEYFGYIYDKQGNRIGIEQVDITRYGQPSFLPVEKVLIREGEEQLIIWQEEKCLQDTKQGISAIGNNLPQFWMAFGVFVGIINNRYFILTKQSTEKAIRRLL